MMRGAPLFALFISVVPVTAYTWPHIYIPNDLECVGENACKHQPKIVEGSSSVTSTATLAPIYTWPRA